jgi:NAD(P)-dependent dehydrogenase (short-subunit alcohol dehydrogenase family)
MEELSGLTAWITGTASGIGRASAFRLAAAGAVVTGLDLDGAGLDAAWHGLTGAAFVADVSDLHSMERAHRALHNLVGPPDMLINAAGIAGSESMDSHDPCVCEEALRDLLGIPDGWDIAALLPFGYPKGRHGPPHRWPVETSVYWDKWGEARPRLPEIMSAGSSDHSSG